MWHMDLSIKRVGISCVLKVTPSKLVFIKLNFTSREPNFHSFLGRAVIYSKPPAFNQCLFLKDSNQSNQVHFQYRENPIILNV